MTKSKRRRRECLSVKETERLWRKFLRQPQQITCEQVEAMEANFVRQLAGSGPIRRSALASLARSGRELEQSFGRNADRTTAEVAAQLAASIRSMRKFLLDVADCLDTAATRIDLSLCGREDMHELMTIAGTDGHTPRLAPVH